MGHESLKGHLLIAAPALMDPNFKRSVVFMAEHSEEGALGLVLNRPTDLSVAKLWETLVAGEEVHVGSYTFLGGPVQKNAVLLLHGRGELSGDTEPVIPGIYLGSDVELLGELVRQAEQNPDQERDFRVFCGYAGWGPGQLDAEMAAGGWLTAPATSDLVLKSPPGELWSDALASLGGIYRLLAEMPPRPELN